jgi:hypothetical protein
MRSRHAACHCLTPTSTFSTTAHAVIDEEHLAGNT